MSVNTAWFDSAIKKVNSFNACYDLEQEAAKLIAKTAKQQAAIASRLEELAPYLALLNPPTIDTIITWVTNFIAAEIGPKVAAYEKYVIDAAIYATKTAELLAAIAAKTSELGCSGGEAQSLMSVPALPSLPIKP